MTQLATDKFHSLVESGRNLVSKMKNTECVSNGLFFPVAKLMYGGLFSQHVQAFYIIQPYLLSQ